MLPLAKAPNIPSNAVDAEKGNQLFPVFIKLNRLHTLLVGGGAIGLEKLTAIVNNSAGAKIKVVAENVSSAICALAEDNEFLTVIQK